MSRWSITVVAVVYVIVGLLRFWPPWYEHNGSLITMVAWISFFFQIYLVQAGLTVLVIAIALAAFRQFIPTLALLPLTALLIAPAYTSVMDHIDLYSDRESFQVMSINVLMTNRRYDDIIHEIKEVDPSIILFQEFTPQFQEAMRKQLGETYPYVRLEDRTANYGVALYSRFKIIEPPVSAGHPSISTERAREAVGSVEIQTGKHKLRFISFHAYPPQSFRHFKHARAQFADLLKRIDHSNVPTVIAGDFNFNEFTPQHRSLEGRGMKDAWEQMGRNGGNTWPVIGEYAWLPDIRIDHMYVSKELGINDMGVGNSNGSDHRPIWANIVVLDSAS